MGQKGIYNGTKADGDRKKVSLRSFKALDLPVSSAATSATPRCLQNQKYSGISSAFSNSLCTPTTPSNSSSPMMEVFATMSTFKIPKFPTHEAAKRGNLPELQRLFDFPEENPFRTDYSGKTVLHHAANFGNPKISFAMSEVILNCKYFENHPNSEKSKFVNIQDEDGETALHLAAKNACRKVVVLLLSNKADVNLESKEKKEAIELVYTFVPNAMITFFDDSVTSNYTELHEEKFEVNINFASIVGIPDPSESTLFVETELLKYALNGSTSKYKDLLLHPVVQLFLHYKWKKIQVLFVASILFHVGWLLIYTWFVIDLFLKKCPYNPTQSNYSHIFQAQGEIDCPTDQLNIPLAWILISATLITAFKELYQLCTAPSCGFYFTHLENIGQILVIIAATVAAFPVIKYSLMFLVQLSDYAYKNNANDGDDNDSNNTNGPSLITSSNSTTLSLLSWNYQMAAYGIFLSWTLILLQIGKTPKLGLYVAVLVKVLKSFGLFILTFISLLTAFALSFSILLPQNQMFSSIPLALSKVLVMMTGELNYDDIFYNQDDDGDGTNTTDVDDANSKMLPFPISTQLFFAAFVIMVTIILFNLLIGFTVSDIQGLQETASVSELCSQLEQIYLMESFLFSSSVVTFLGVFRLRPETWLRRFMVTGHSCEDTTTSLEEEPSFVHSHTTTSTTSDPILFNTTVTKTTKQIPKKLRKAVKKLAIRNLEASKLDEKEESLADDSGQEFKSLLSEAELKALISKAVCDTLAEHFNIPPGQNHKSTEV